MLSRRKKKIIQRKDSKGNEEKEWNNVAYKKRIYKQEK